MPWDLAAISKLSTALAQIPIEISKFCTFLSLHRPVVHAAPLRNNSRSSRRLAPHCSAPAKRSNLPQSQALAEPEGGNGGHGCPTPQNEQNLADFLQKHYVFTIFPSWPPPKRRSCVRQWSQGHFRHRIDISSLFYSSLLSWRCLHKYLPLLTGWSSATAIPC